MENKFTLTELIDFGNYLLSEYRMNMVTQKDAVHDADIANWLHRVN
jgi:hypothetical protein